MLERGSAEKQRAKGIEEVTELYRAVTFRNRTSGARGVLEETSPKVRDLLLERRRALRETRNDPRLTDEYRRQRTAELEQGFAARLEEIRSEARTAHEELSRIAREPFAERGSTEEQLLSQIKAQRAWSRFVRLLDSEDTDVGPTELVGRLADEQDAAGLKVMSEELPGYLESQGWTPQHVQTIRDQISRSEMPLLPPEERAARYLQQEVEAGWPRLDIAFAHAEMDFSGSDVPTTELPSWSGESMPVPEAGPASAGGA